MNRIKKTFWNYHYLRAVVAERLKEADMKKRAFMYFQLSSVTAVLLGTALLSLTAGPGFAQQRNPERNAYFGETHVHTSWSLDAFSSGTALTLIVKAKTKEEMTRVALYAINTLASGPPVKELMAPEVAGTVWKRNVELGDKANH